MSELTAQLAGQRHECVPLGWNPVPAAGWYYPGRTVEFHDASWLQPLWLGRIRASDLRDPHVRTTYAVLNDLVQKGLLVRRTLPGATQYHLTIRAIQYYYDDNSYRSNPDHLPFLCYTRIVPQRVIWNQAVHWERDASGERVQMFRVGFEWRVSAAAEWADDPLLRSHSVVLAPETNPAVAQFVKRGDGWEIAKIYSADAGLPRVSDAAVWLK